MTIALWCVCVAGFMPYLWSTLAKADPAYDNRCPRLHSRTGWRQRADWAQQNSWEAFAPFAIAVLVAQGVQVAQPDVDQLALGFIGLRVVYGLCYLLNWSLMRSLVWTAGLACTIGLYVLAARV